MFKRICIAAIMMALITLHANAQYYKIKWKPVSGMIHNSFYTVPNYKPFDMDNDGISEIVTWEQSGDTVYCGSIYDGATYALKYQIKLKYTFNGKICMPNISIPRLVCGFYNIDGDNVKELICAGKDDSLRNGYLFINVFTDQVEFFINDMAMPDYPPGFSDIDNDGYIEMITLNAVIGHSTTPVAQSPFLSKRSDPMVKLYPNPITSSAKIEYYVPFAAHIKIGIFDISGKLIRTLVNANKNAGDFMEIWDGKSDDNKNLASGQYYYNVQIGNFRTKKKVILLQ